MMGHCPDPRQTLCLMLARLVGWLVGSAGGGFSSVAIYFVHEEAGASVRILPMVEIREREQPKQAPKSSITSYFKS